MAVVELLEDGWMKCDCGAHFQIVVNAPSVLYANAEYCPYCGGELDFESLEHGKGLE